MLKVSDDIYTGDSYDEQTARICTVLNVASDLAPTRDTDTYYHIGLVDGPGNPLSMYCAAVLTLDALRRKGDVLVCDHTGKSISMAIVIMWTRLNIARTWDQLLLMLEERFCCELPEPHEAHKYAFNKIDWVAMEKLL
jgi:hypothetical protein